MTAPNCEHCATPMLRKLYTAFHRPATADGTPAKWWVGWCCPKGHVDSSQDGVWMSEAVSGAQKPQGAPSLL